MKAGKKIWAAWMAALLLGSGCAAVPAQYQPAVPDPIFYPEPMATNIQFDELEETDGGIFQTTNRVDAQSARENSEMEHNQQIQSMEGIADHDSQEMTLMIYMVGSDLESRNGLASCDLDEIISSGLANENVNIVLLAGGTSAWQNGLSSENSYIYLYRDGKWGRSTIDPLDMGDPSTLCSFLNTCTESFPAEHNGLILWDHGSGPIFGYGNDEVTGNMLLMNGIYAALENSAYNRDNLDFIAFDACVMGSYEVASVLSDFTDRLVVSSELVPGTGMNYDYLSTLNESFDREKIIRSMIDQSQDWYVEASRILQDSSQTTVFCEYDLTKARKVEQAVDSIFTAARNQAEQDPELWKKMTRARSKALEYGVSEDGTFDLADLGDLSSYWMEWFPQEAASLQDALREMVVYGRSSIKGSTGVSMYYPYARSDIYEMVCSVEDRPSVLLICEPMMDFLEMYPASISGSVQTESQNAPSRTVRLNTEKETLQEGVINLPEDLKDEVLTASMTVYEALQVGDAEEKYAYLPVLEELPVDVREDQLVFDPDPMILTWTIPDQQPSPLRFRFIRRDDEQKIYQSVMARAFSDQIHLPNIESKPCTMQVRADMKDGSVQIESFASINEEKDAQDLAPSGKNDMLMIDYHAIGFDYPTNQSLIDPEKTLEQQEDSGTAYLRTMTYSDKANLQGIRASELKGADLYYQIILIDTDGNRHAAVFDKLNPENDAQETSVQTDKGTLKFLMQDDQAILTGYTGTDESITIPETVEGKTVKAIGPGAFTRVMIGEEDHARTRLKTVVLPETIESIGNEAFYRASGLQQINLPDGVKFIGDHAFAGCDLQELKIPGNVESIGDYAFYFAGGDEAFEKLSLPKTLKRVGEGAFTGMRFESIEADAANETVSVKDYFLLSKDGSVLIDWCGPMQEEIVVPEGVKRIGPSAFEGNACYDGEKAGQGTLKNVQLPEGVEQIDLYAFYDIPTLRQINLPDSLTKISPYAFGSAAPSKVESGIELTIPKNVTDIGYDCFAGLKGLKLSVDEQNPYFKMTAGVLTNKAGDQPILCGLQIE